MAQSFVSTESNLVEVLRRRALDQPDRTAYVFLSDGEAEEARLTYAELDRRARAIAAFLQSVNAASERMLLLYPPGLDYIAAFFGCLYARAIAVPTYPPRQSRSFDRLYGIARDSGARFALTTRSIQDGVDRRGGSVEGGAGAERLPHQEALTPSSPLAARRAMGTSIEELPGLHWIATGDLKDTLADEWVQLDSSSVAFLQYTSGSTSTPKGVMVSHGNLLHNQRVIQTACGHTDASTFVGWLPLYHDMGLIGNVLQPLYIGAPGILMSPASFLQRPLRWLEAISRYRAHTSGGPNFAYDLCARRSAEEDTTKLDLRSWSVAFNGAEPIRPETIERFSAAFAPCGFRREAFFPCYGLAEGTLFVTGRRANSNLPLTVKIRRDELSNHRAVPTDDAAEAQAIVSCGGPVLGQKVRIVHPETLLPCDEGEIGEVWISGESVAQGYWERPEESRETFGARLAGSGEGPFLRTGDLAFLRNGELFLTGRLKDLVIIRGLNHYPQDIERTVERCHPELRPACGAAFAVEAAQEERLVIVHEVQSRRPREVEAILSRIREAVADEHELQVHAILLLRPGNIPKTSSGKLQRHVCKQLFLSRGFTAVAQWQATEQQCEAAVIGSHDRVEALEEWLRNYLAAKLGMAQPDLDGGKPLAAFGLDSLQAVELAHKLERDLNIRLPLSNLADASIRRIVAAAVDQAGAGEPVSVGGPPELPEHPLSRGQQALFFLQETEPAGAAYLIARAARMDGELDSRALREAVEFLIDRHEALRTTFAMRRGTPVAILRDRMEAALSEYDASSWDETALEEQLASEAHRPIDLERGPLLRLHVYHRGPAEHILLLVVHHLVCDFWSLAIFARELELAYQARIRGATPALASPVTRYVDYVRRQEALLAGTKGDELWNYWRQQLTGSDTVLHLPTDRPRPPRQTYSGACFARELSPEITRSIQRFAEAHEVTLFVTLLAAYQVLLHRYTGQERFLVGCPAAGRGCSEFADTIGYFVNPAPLEARLGGNPTFEDVVQRLRKTVSGAFQHQDYPFPLLVERLQPQRDASRPPLFQTMLVMQTTPPSAGQDLSSFALGAAGPRLRGDLPLQSIPLENRTAQFDVVLSIAIVGDRLTASWQYNTGLFDRGTIERMAGHFAELLRGILADPCRRISDLPILTAPEQRAIVEDWNRTETIYPDSPLLHVLFEDQAARTPSAPAVVFQDRELTYGELNDRANRLAHYLIGIGAGLETRVAILMERSPDLVIALLGVLKTGAAYVPIDPEYPTDRIGYMIEDARAAVILTQHHLRMPADGQTAAAVCVDEDWGQIETFPVRNPRHIGTPDNLAYVIYTSGSTGRPKGAMNTHGAICNRLLWMQGAYRLTEQDRILQKTPFSFDVSVWEFFWPLLNGAALVLAEPGGHRDPSYLTSIIRRHGITTVHFVPSMLAAWLDDPGAPKCSSLKRVICSGEALPLELQQRFFKAHAAELHNLYGPTEAAVDVTHWKGRRDVNLDTVPIGRPIANTRIYLLDRSGNPVPAGIPGELHIGGAPLARGYFNRPDLTAEKFIPDPFSEIPGARLYRTGDLARYLPDGSIDFLGRIDGQVKIHGFRIELGEIETALRDHCAVKQSAVAARPDSHGHARLVAYLVFGAEPRPAVPELQAFLRRTLPDYMIPAAFVVLDALPLTPSGKVDRLALPEAAPQPEDGGLGFVAPRSHAEKALAAVWEEVLGLSRVGVHDNFFALGGDSIRSIRVRALMLEKGYSISLQEILRHQTIADLAAMAIPVTPGVKAQGPPDRFSLVRDEDRHIIPEGVEDAYPLTKLQLGLVFHSQHDPDYEAYVTSLHVRAPLDPDGLQWALDALVARHAMLRTAFDLTTFSEPLQIVYATAPVRAGVEDIRRLDHESQNALLKAYCERERRRSFDWSHPALFRIQVHRRSAETFQLTLTEPFLDGWSVALALTELLTAYATRSQSAQPPAASFRDYVAAEIEMLRSADSRQYWKEKLRDAATGILPERRSDEIAQETRRVDRVEVPIHSEVSDGLHALARAAAAPIKSVLLAAHLKVIGFLTGQAEALTGVLYNGRPETKDGDRVIGLFLNAVPFRQRLVRGTWLALAQRTFQSEDEMLPFRRYPLSEILRDHGRERLFESVFNFTHFHEYKVSGADRVEILEGYASDQTYFGLTAQFNIDHANRDQRVRLWLDYRTARFTHKQARAIGGYYAQALRAMSRDPYARHDGVCLLGTEEREVTVVDRNRTCMPQFLGKCLHELVEAKADRTPDTVAVICEGERLTFRELNRRANRLARYLQAQGVAPDILVGILMERSLEMVIGLLAVLKAGGAYVPLDPSYPRARLAFMVEDASLRFLLAHARTTTLLPPGQRNAIFTDRDHEAIERFSGENTHSGAAPENLAYMIYTSGSTGRPKGAMNTHQAICNRLLWMQEAYRLNRQDRVLQKTSVGFDVSVWEFFWPLLSGACLVLAKPGGHRDGEYLLDVIRGERITTIHFVPSMLRALLEEPGFESCTSLRRVICSGEALSYDLQQLFFARSRAELHNLYGPTEAAVDVTAWDCRRDGRRQSVPIGRPIANTQIYPLDRDRLPVPDMVAGELYIGGAGLARGYWGQPGLTAENFIPNPFSADPGARLYRTGDLGRYLPDGSIEFLGRSDDQVKIRGFRIELGEIEAVLRAHPGVRESVVLAARSASGISQLIGYVQPASDMELPVRELRSFLVARLPDYMAPHRFVIVRSFPTTESGKIDRRRLESEHQQPQAELNRLLSHVGQMSDDEARQLLAVRSGRN